MNSWNAYKVFANGKRAKMPFMSFDAEESNHFFSDILPTLDKKVQKNKWTILNVNEPQEREEEARDEEHERFVKMRTRFLSKMAVQKYPNLAINNVQSCLLMSSDIDWKWAWCIVEGSSHKFIAEISDRFSTASAAEKWLKEQVECMGGN